MYMLAKIFTLQVPDTCSDFHHQKKPTWITLQLFKCRVYLIIKRGICRVTIQFFKSHFATVVHACRVFLCPLKETALVAESSKLWTTNGQPAGHSRALRWNNSLLALDVSFFFCTPLSIKTILVFQYKRVNGLSNQSLRLESGISDVLLFRFLAAVAVGARVRSFIWMT